MRAGIISFIAITRLVIRCRDVYLKVRQVRNDILHSPNLEVTSADLTTYLDKMRDLLQEPALNNYASARRAVDEINKVIMFSIYFIVYDR